jgi:hypothetical protein
MFYLWRFRLTWGISIDRNEWWRIALPLAVVPN